MRPIVLPRFAAGGVVSVVRFHVHPGDVVEMGTALLDYVVDLSAGAAHDCAPVLGMRLVANEAGRVSELCVQVGEVLDPEAVLAVVDAAPAPGLSERPLRTSAIGIEYDPLFDE